MVPTPPYRSHGALLLTPSGVLLILPAVAALGLLVLCGSLVPMVSALAVEIWLVLGW